MLTETVELWKALGQTAPTEQSQPAGLADGGGRFKVSEHGRQNIFISYAHEDRYWKDEFETMLAPVRERGIIGWWSDENIEVGENWSKSIQRALENTGVGLLLVTDHFLNSTFITQVELKNLLESAKTRGVSIRWVPISASLYRYSDLNEIQAAWDPETPLESLREAERTAAIQKICLEIVERFGSPAAVSESRRGSLRARVEARVRDRYTLGDELATGKLSVVYRAEQMFLKRLVVVKALVASEIDDWGRREFVVRAQRAAELQSAAFIKVLDHFMDESPECLVSEFVTGQRLSNVLWKYPNGLPLPQVRSIILGLASALEESNNRGWRRGELCPSDILMDESGLARISAMDFSNILREEGQVTGNLVLDRESLSYMTPERFAGTAPSVLTDQYSLGLIATELIGGSHIPRVVHPQDLLGKPRLFADLESGKGAWAKCSPELAGVVSRMLRQEPSERWPSMTHVRRLIAGIDVEPDERQRRIATASYLRLQASVDRQRELFDSFYKSFLAEAGEDIKKHFEKIDMDRQYKLLNQAIHTLLEFRPSASWARKDLKNLVTRHVHLGLNAKHYRLFLDVFIRTIQSSGGQDLEEAAAWRESLQAGIEYMCECADEEQPSDLGNTPLRKRSTA